MASTNTTPSIARPKAPLGIGAVVLSFVDQGLHSLGSLVLSAFLIAGTDPATFGRFAFVTTCALVAASLHYGAIGVPLLVHVRQAHAADRMQQLAILRSVDLRFRAAAALVVGLAAFWASGSIATALAGAAFVVAWLARETRRNLFYLEGDSRSAARFGATSFVLLLLVYAILFYLERSELAALMAAALSTVLALAAFPARHERNDAAITGLLQRYRQTFPGAGWSLLNSATNEAQTRAHVLVIQLVRGADQVGLIEAGRILWAPLQLMGSAWQRVAQPRIAGLVEAGDLATARWLTLAGIGLMVAATAFCGGAIAALWPLIERHLFAKFSDIGPLVAGWGFVSLLVLSNWSLVVFLNATRRFRLIAMVGIAAATATTGLLAALAFDVDLVIALVAMAVVQLAMLTAFLLVGLRNVAMPLGGSRP
ncbi:lipopolysaccharide biosynthesis protein [Aminobacter sp. J44]|uniref:lipopolysaccharide biosynthesis protein n=1 Tax=Aminobacter sp. J44 TaxID=935262 RepID=UPI00119A6AD5|nr:hypothetical protein [Aminobacter sp. J44]TWG49333.1 O-antigen/teichoic acid export membrane protein [Aminobacter sp. J44]